MEHETVVNPPRSRLVPFIIAGLAGVVIMAGGALFLRARAETNHVALDAEPKGVTVVTATAATFRASRRYVATVEPWVSANIGPQLVSAFLDTVLVRPGTTVKKGEVLATLDCRNASAGSSAVAQRARALEAKQTALAKESARVTGLLDGGFVSPNEAEQKQADTASMEAQLLATKAQLVGTSLEVADCILRSPFDGEIAQRFMDPGAFVRPGQPIVSVVDRTTVRVAADVPESDFDIVKPGTEVAARLLSTDRPITGRVARRAPSADSATRTIRFEMDVPDPDRAIPVGTSADLHVDVGEPMPATSIPLTAASVRGVKATVFVVEKDVARQRTFKVLGERAGTLFVEASLPAGAQLVTEGRALLADGDRVRAKVVDQVAGKAVR